MLSGALSGFSDRLDPVRLREFVRLSNTQNRDAFASLGPFLRSLTGTEKVHLASSRTRRSDPRLRYSITRDTLNEPGKTKHAPVDLLLIEPRIVCGPGTLDLFESVSRHFSPLPESRR